MNVTRLKLNSAGIAHIVVPVMALLLIGGIGTLVALKSQGHADAATPSPAFCAANGLVYKDGKCVTPSSSHTLTILPSGLVSNSSAKRLSDSTYNQVMRIRDSGGGATTSSKENAKIAAFVKKYRGHSAKLCVVAKRTKTYSAEANKLDFSTGDINSAQHLDVTPGKSYSKKCLSFTIKSDATGSAGISVAPNAIGEGQTVYVANFTITAS